MSQDGSRDLQTGGLTGRPPKRKYTNKACEECRRRRSKCDGNKPACARCIARAVECSYTAEEDGRRPASKTYVQLLRQRIDHLERLLLSQENEGTASGRLTLEDTNLTESRTTRDDLLYSDDGDICADFEGALCLDDSLNFDGDGQPRYFGVTSGRLEFESLVSRASRNEQTGSHSIRSSDRRRFHRVFQELESETDHQISEELESHLIDLYFRWEQPWKQVVDEKLFRESKQSEGKYFSHLLLNSILAYGSRHSDRLEVRSDPGDPNSAGKLFLEKAEALLPFDMKWPSITTIQALAILGSLYCAIGSDAAGWLHQGMSTRLALDMGFNHDPAKFKGSLTQEEIELRRQIYWALYSDDKLFASYTGRICTMLDSQGVVELPSATGTPLIDQSHLGPESLWKDNYRQLVLLNRALATHCQILEKILLTLYAPKPLLRGSQRRSFCSSCILELKTWFYDLPSGLRIDRPRDDILPPVFTLHMVHYTAFILLLKPFIFTSGEPANQRPDLPNSPTGKSPLDVCYEATRQLCIVSRKYRQVFGSFRKSPITATHCTLSAALFLLRKMKHDGSGQKAIDQNLFKSCLQTLKELGTSWYPAWRYWNNLSHEFAALYHASGHSETCQTEVGRVPAPVATLADDRGDSELFLNPTWSDTMDWAINLPEDLDYASTDEQGSSGNSIPVPDISSWQDISSSFLFDSLPADYTDFNAFTGNM